MLRADKTRDDGFRLIMNTYKEKIYWFIRRFVISHEDAEDVFQETFINVYRYGHSFNGNSKFNTWLYKVATNECIRHLKSRKKELHKVEMTRMQMGNFETTNEVDERDILIKFQKAILMLPDKQRIVFNMRYYDELSYKEIADILNTSENSLKTNYHYATEKIKTYLKEIE